MRRTTEQQVAFDGGYGRRGISHHRDNPHPASTDLHGHWNAGFDKADAELSRGADRGDGAAAERYEPVLDDAGFLTGYHRDKATGEVITLGDEYDD